MIIRWLFLMLFCFNISLKAEFIQWPWAKVEQSTEQACAVIRNSIKRIEAKYKVSCIGTGLSMPGGPIRLVCLSLQVKGPQPKEYIRRLLISCTHEMIQVAYDNPAIESFLYRPPFGVEQVEIILFVIDRNGRDVCEPHISSAQIMDGKLEYHIYDSSRRLTQIEEIYEEAWQIIQDEDSALDNTKGCSCCGADTPRSQSSVCASPEPIRKSRRGWKRWGQRGF